MNLVSVHCPSSKDNLLQSEMETVPQDSRHRNLPNAVSRKRVGRFGFVAVTVADAEERAGAQCLVISVIVHYVLILLCWS